jgi:cell division protein FtsX
MPSVTTTSGSASLLGAQHLADGPLSHKAATKSAGWARWLPMALITAFAGLALVNTSVMALIARRNELALVSLIGATPGQARRQID